MKNKGRLKTFKNLIIWIIAIFALVWLYVFKDSNIAMGFLILVIIYWMLYVFLVNYSIKKIHGKFKNEKGLIEIKNDGFLPVDISFDITTKNIITGQSETEKINTYIDFCQSIEAEYDISSKYCGAVDVTIENIITMDLTGVIFRKQKTKETKRIYIWPQLEEIPLLMESTDRFDMESYKFADYRNGDDPSETYGIDDYKEGDNIKSIHWKLSSKRDEIVVRELGYPIDNRTIVLIDKGMDKDKILSPEERNKVATYCLSFCYTLLKNEVMYDLGWYDYNGQEFVLIDGEDDNFEKNFLSCPFEVDEVQVDYRYIESMEDKKYSNYIVITNREISQERLMNYGEVTVYKPQ